MEKKFKKSRAHLPQVFKTFCVLILFNYQKSYRKRWASLIRKIYEVDPRGTHPVDGSCPKCGSTMKIVSAIKDDIAIHKILSHLGLLYPPNSLPHQELIQMAQLRILQHQLLILRVHTVQQMAQAQQQGLIILLL